MKYCPKCGTEMADESSYCPKCGAWQNFEPAPEPQYKAQPAQTKPNTGIITANKVLLIITCVGLGIVLLFGIIFGILAAVTYQETTQPPVDLETEGAWIGLMVMAIYMCALALPLAWVIPMTVNYFKKTKAGKPMTVAFKVCMLLFVNLLVGVFMLCFEPHADDVQG